MSADGPGPASPEEVQDGAEGLLRWIGSRDWRGHDPFDLLLSPWAAPVRPFRWPSVVWTQIGRRSPIDFRRALSVPPHENPKALALGILGCMSLRAAGRREAGAGAVASGLVDRLLAAEAEGGGWGYPFPWANRHFKVAAGTPSGVVTAFATQALLAARDGGLVPAARIDDIEGSVLRGADFVHRRLRRLATPHGPLLSYTPVDERAVHNASVLASTVLARGASLPGGDSGWADLATGVASSTLSAQRADGSWPYGTSGRDGFIDSYHTGYVLTALRELDGTLPLDGVGPALDRGFRYWKRAFLAGPAVGPAPHVSFPVDLHGLAQGILTLLEWNEKGEAMRLAGWAMGHARRADGAFVFTWSPRRVNRIAYLRWVQSWMFRALSALTAT
jgi:hypothetical protein